MIMSNMPEVKIGVVGCQPRLLPGESVRDEKRESDEGLSRKIRGGRNL